MPDILYPASVAISNLISDIPYVLCAVAAMLAVATVSVAAFYYKYYT